MLHKFKRRILSSRVTLNQVPVLLVPYDITKVFQIELSIAFSPALPLTPC